MELPRTRSDIEVASSLSRDFISLSRKLRKVIKSIKYARSEIQILIDEIDIFAQLFDDFVQLYYVQESSGSISADKLMIWSKEAINGIRMLLDSVRALSKSEYRNLLEIVETVAAHVKWYFSKDAVRSMKASLSVGRESINAYLNLRCLETLNAQLEILIARSEQGIPLSEKEEREVKVIKARIEVRQATRKSTDKRLQRGLEKVVGYDKEAKVRAFLPDPSQLIDFSDSIQDRASDVLPMTRGSRRPTRPMSRNPIPGPTILSQPRVAPRRPISAQRTQPMTTVPPPPRMVPRPRKVPLRRRSPGPSTSGTSSLILLTTIPTSTPPNTSTDTEASSPRPLSTSSSNLSSLTHSSTSAMIDGQTTNSAIKQRTLLRPISPPRSATSQGTSPRALKIQKAKAKDTRVVPSPDQPDSPTPSSSQVPNEPQGATQIEVFDWEVSKEKNIMSDPGNLDQHEDTDVPITGDENEVEEKDNSNSDSDAPSPYIPLTGRQGRMPPSLRDRRKKREAEGEDQNEN